jgi:uncharacterized protein YecT (DUF1311 family)
VSGTVGILKWIALSIFAVLLAVIGRGALFCVRHERPFRTSIAALFLLLATRAAYGEVRPSFDCTRAHSPTEEFICANPDIAELDQVLASAYQNALRAGKADKASQQAWLRRRDTDCITGDLRECLRGRMTERLSELQEAYGFAYGTATCSPEKGLARIEFDTPYIAPEDREDGADNGADPNRTYSWRCDLAPQWSVTVKYRFYSDPRSCPGIATIWENGVVVDRQSHIGARCSFYVLKSATITAEGLEACYLSDDPANQEQRCDLTPRKRLPLSKDSLGKDPFFTPGRAPGEPEAKPIDAPMRQVQGWDDPRCKRFADRLRANWADDMTDLAAQVAWRQVEVPSSFGVPTAVSEFDIDNDGQPDVVLRITWESHMVEGDRYAVFPSDSWVHDLRIVNDEQAFFTALRKDMSEDEKAHPGKGYFIANPFGRGDEHYTVSALKIADKTIIFARIADYDEAWRVKDGQSAGSPTRIFFEVQKSGEIAIDCAFAPPLRLGEQL